MASRGSKSTAQETTRRTARGEESVSAPPAVGPIEGSGKSDKWFEVMLDGSLAKPTAVQAKNESEAVDKFKAGWGIRRSSKQFACREIDSPEAVTKTDKT